MSVRAKRIAYWSATVLTAFFIGSGGLSQILVMRNDGRGKVPLLEYPAYFFVILGVWKVLGAMAILAPRLPRLKEWAYAGIVFDLTGAAASFLAVHEAGAYGFHVIAPLVLTGLTAVSWALRPADRVTGTLRPVGGVL